MKKKKSFAGIFERARAFTQRVVERKKKKPNRARLFSLFLSPFIFLYYTQTHTDINAMVGKRWREKGYTATSYISLEKKKKMMEI